MSPSTTSNHRVEILNKIDAIISNCTDAVATDSSSTAGRKTWGGIDPGVVVAKLARAFALDCTVKEACIYAGISRDSFYRFCAKYPEFRNTLESFRMSPVLSARMAWIDAFAVHGNWWAAFKYLEIHCPEEYGRGRQVSATPVNTPRIKLTIHD